MGENNEKDIYGFDRFNRVYVFLTNGQSMTLDKVEWEFTDWGVIYGNNKKTILIPWTQIKQVQQLHSD